MLMSDGKHQILIFGVDQRRHATMRWCRRCRACADEHARAMQDSQRAADPHGRHHGDGHADDGDEQRSRSDRCDAQQVQPAPVSTMVTE